MKTLLSIALTPISYFAVYVLVLLVGSIYVITFPIPPRYMQWYLRISCRVILLCCGQWLKVEGNAPNQDEGPYLYLSNHQSALDMFIIGAVIPEYFGIVAAEYHFKIPFWRYIAKRFGAIPVEREKHDEAVVSMNKIEKILTSSDENERRSVLIFVEGTRTPNGELQPFKMGAFHVAKNTGAVIVPCGISGAFESYSRYSWLIHPGVVTWTWGDPQHEIANNYRCCNVHELANFCQTKIGMLTRKSNPC